VRSAPCSPRRPGRPPLPVDIRLGSRLIVRLSPGDHEAVRHRAAEAGLLLSIYVRHTLLDRQLPTVAPAANLRVLRELNRIGNNLNQLTRLAHTGRVSRKLLQLVEDLAERIRAYHRALLGLDDRPPD
jgi:mobilization protein NikA